jgi:hypothetical protein
MEKPKRKRERKKGVVFYDVVYRIQTFSNDQVTLSFIPEGDSRESISYILQLGNNLGGQLNF